MFDMVELVFLSPTVTTSYGGGGRGGFGPNSGDNKTQLRGVSGDANTGGGGGGSWK